MVERQLWHGDQADGLRRLFGSRSPQVVAFVSGRETSGRGALVVQTAVALASAGHGVVIVDENPAPDNTLSAFGLTARSDLLNIVRGDRSLNQVIVSAAPLVRILPASRAARELDLTGEASRQRLAAALGDMQKGADFVLIDCTSRYGSVLSPVAVSARYVVVIVAAQAAAITHAYALIKRIVREQGRDSFHIAVTRARSVEEARAVFANMRRVAREHLGVRLEWLGAAKAPVTGNLAEALIHGLPPDIDELADEAPSALRAMTAARAALADSML